MSRKIYFNVFFKKILRIKNLQKKNLTHQEIFGYFNEEEKQKWGEILKIFEKNKFTQNKKNSFSDFLKTNLLIFRI